MSDEKKNWFQRISEGILTPSNKKKDVPAGLWFKCPKCKKRIPQNEHKDNLWVCSCAYHDRIAPKNYFDILFDTPRYKLHFENLTAKDPLEFKDLKDYPSRLEQAKTKSGVNEAIQVAVGKMNEQRTVIAAMNFAFIGGSMNSVVGEKISRAIDFCIENKLPLIIISKSGGARMMEAGLSLMQMIKTSAKLTQLAKAKLPYISLMTDPTTGGVTASFSMLGDLNIGEPGALIGFAGPRVIKDFTNKKTLPDGFQSSEFLLDKGFLDLIVERKDLKEKISESISILMNK
ncbi:MAG: acetyl-CoA carboxylase, carboxyltransferase subunit beta [Chitinophagales bacterium]